MRMACILFPRLPIQLARRGHAELPRSLVLLAGDGDGALVSAASPDASAAGITVGMSAAGARARCSSAAFLPDNAGECLETLEAASAILRARATPSVAIGGRDHLFISLAGLELLFVDEATAASALVALVRTWTGFDGRAGVAGTRDAALEAARTARRYPVVVIESDTSGWETIAPWHDDTLTARHNFPSASTSKDVRARLVHLLLRLEAILDGRGESFREVTVTLGTTAGGSNSWRVGSRAPMQRAAEALALLGEQLGPSAFESVERIDVELARLGPAMEVVPSPAMAAPAVFIQSPARPRQAHLLRAS